MHSSPVEGVLVRLRYPDSDREVVRVAVELDFRTQAEGLRLGVSPSRNHVGEMQHLDGVPDDPDGYNLVLMQPI